MSASGRMTADPSRISPGTPNPNPPGSIATPRPSRPVPPQSNPSRSFSDPIEPLLQPSSDIRARYGVDDPARRASWTPAVKMHVLQGDRRSDERNDGERGREADNALPSAGRASVGDGRVPYGPGFYIPPPGYRTWSSTSAPCDVRTREPDARPVGATSFDDTTKKVQRQAAGRRKQAHPHRKREDALPSSRGSLIVWALLSVLLAISQLTLLARYHLGDNTVPIGLIWAAVYLELYAAFVSTMALLIAMNTSSASKGSKQAREKSITSTLLSTLPDVCGFAVGLGAALQLASATLYALLSAENMISYSVITALTTSLLITLISVGRIMYLDGHLACNRRSRPPHKPHLPLTNPGASSRSSSISSHGGQYVPDYGLDSDSDSGGSDAGTRRPRADWTDRVLDGVVRSPLLDMPTRLPH